LSFADEIEDHEKNRTSAPVKKTVNRFLFIRTASFGNRP
jgi:hypothetical protein